MSSPFDYVNEILQTKKQLIVDAQTEKAYEPFLVNKTLSYHKDCILFANEMNRRHQLDKKLQNDYLLNTIRPRKRSFNKWVKAEKSEDLACVKTYFGYSDAKAREALRLLSDEQIQQLKEKTDTGGLRK
jgi:hypothetical protein